MERFVRILFHAMSYAEGDSAYETRELEDDFEQLSTMQRGLESKLTSYRQQLDVLHGLQDAMAKSERECSKQVKHVSLAIREMTKSGLLKDEQKRKFNAGLEDARASASALRDALPHTGSRFLENFIGSVNVVLSERGERLRYKAEYERFKSRFSYFLIVINALAMNYGQQVPAFELILDGSLVYFYVTLLLREKILINNGSSIKFWWILHHYISLAGSLTMLTWSVDDVCHRLFFSQLHWYFVYLQFIQQLQTYYQSGRLYTLRSLGRAGQMDVANSDSTQLRWTSSFLFVMLPFLMFGQCYQVYNGVTLLHTGLTLANADWQVFALGVFFLVLGTGNFATTMFTLVKKLKRGQGAGGEKASAKKKR